MNNKDEIKAILADRKGHLLHEFINSDEPLHPIIDFNLLQEVYDNIKPKLMCKEVLNTLNHVSKDVCLEIFSKWDKNSITITSSSNMKKISLHIFTTSMRLQNII